MKRKRLTDELWNVTRDAILEETKQRYEPMDTHVSDPRLESLKCLLPIPRQLAQVRELVVDYVDMAEIVHAENVLTVAKGYRAALKKRLNYFRSGFTKRLSEHGTQKMSFQQGLDYDIKECDPEHPPIASWDHAAYDAEALHFVHEYASGRAICLLERYCSLVTNRCVTIRPTICHQSEVSIWVYQLKFAQNSNSIA